MEVKLTKKKSILLHTVHKRRFSLKNVFSKYEQICSGLCGIKKKILCNLLCNLSFDLDELARGWKGMPNTHDSHMV